MSLVDVDEIDARCAVAEIGRAFKFKFSCFKTF